MWISVLTSFPTPKCNNTTNETYFHCHFVPWNSSILLLLLLFRSLYFVRSLLFVFFFCEPFCRLSFHLFLNAIEPTVDGSRSTFYDYFRTFVTHFLQPSTTTTTASAAAAYILLHAFHVTDVLNRYNTTDILRHSSEMAFYRACVCVCFFLSFLMHTTNHAFSHFKLYWLDELFWIKKKFQHFTHRRLFRLLQPFFGGVC